MGIKERVVREVTCDLCGAECAEDDGYIKIQVHPGDGRDVGPGYIEARFNVFLPYVVTGDIVCSPCKFKWLTHYLSLPHPLYSRNQSNP